MSGPGIQLSIGERRWTEPEPLGTVEQHPFRRIYGWTWRKGPVGIFAGLNPSKATASLPDQTVRKWRGFADRFGWGGFLAVNAFSLRSTDPRGLIAYVRSPITAALEDEALTRALLAADGQIVCCWGDPPRPELQPHLDAFLRRLALDGRRLYCLGRTEAGNPKHVSRLAYKTPLEVFPC